MGAPIGNQFWKLRSKHGRDKIFTEPQILWEASIEYFKKVDDSRYGKNELIKSGELAGKSKPNMVDRPYQIGHLCLFLHVNEKYFNQFEAGIKDKDDDISKDFSNVITCIRDVIKCQKLEGAMLGVFDNRIVAQIEGLKDRMEVEQTNPEQINISIDGMKIDLTK
jgi:hypothetical protein